MSQAPQPSAPPAKKASPWTVRRIALAVLLVYGLVLVLANRRSVPVNFVFFKTQGSLFVLILLSLGVGFVIGWLFDDVRDRRRRKRQADKSA